MTSSLRIPSRTHPLLGAAFCIRSPCVCVFTCECAHAGLPQQQPWDSLLADVPPELRSRVEAALKAAQQSGAAEKVMPRHHMSYTPPHVRI